MRILIRLLLAIIIGVAAIFSVSNRTLTIIDFYPLPFSTAAPLYTIVLGALAVGLLLGVGVSTLSRLRLKLKVRNNLKRAEAAEMVLKNKSREVPHSLTKST